MAPEPTAERLARDLNKYEEWCAEHDIAGNPYQDVIYSHPATDHARTNALGDSDQTVICTDGYVVDWDAPSKSWKVYEITD